ncbi:Uncharacterized protein PF11_0207 [Durusdinium trenchii]|uniref:Uncharacterized protein PF11_0207 n=1 Tax=Durusdinium trenchii TaxID=1381693 RepID=A0ABP0SBV1_9DINO
MLHISLAQSGGDARDFGGPDLLRQQEKSEEKKPALGGGGGGKYVPPAQRKAMEEEEARLFCSRQASRPSAKPVSRPRVTAAHEQPAKRKEMEERRNRQRELDRQQEEEKERRREEMRSKQRAEEERRQREEDAKREKREAEEAKKAEAEKQRKMEMKAAKEAEAKERREALKSASQAQKKASQSSGKKQVFDTSKIDGFVDSCEEVVKEEGPVEKLVDELDELLSEDEWSTVQPIARLNEMLLQHCRGKQDEEVFSIVQTWAPMLNCLIEKAGIHRFKVKVLIEAQRAASKMGLPRLSPATALLEAFFDGLYRAEVIEEDYFEMWAVGDDDTAGKTSAMFQVTAFLDWLRGKMDEDEEQEGEGEEEEDEDDDEEEEEEDDIEANVPTTRRK